MAVVGVSGELHSNVSFLIYMENAQGDTSLPGMLAAHIEEPE